MIRAIIKKWILQIQILSLKKNRSLNNTNIPKKKTNNANLLFFEFNGSLYFMGVNNGHFICLNEDLNQHKIIICVSHEALASNMFGIILLQHIM